MENSLQQQLDISKSLLESLDRMVSSFESMLGNTSGQATSSQNIVRDMQNSEDSLDITATKAQNIAQEMSNSVENGFERNVERSSRSTASAMNASMEQNNKRSKNTLRNALRNSAIFVSLRKSTDVINNRLQEASRVMERKLNNSIQRLEKFPRVLKMAKLAVGLMQKAVATLASVKDAFMTGGLSLIKDFFKGLFSILKNLLSMLTSVIGAATKFFMFSMTLPFTIANIAAKIGNTIRRDLVEVIQGAGEEAKESFDLTSRIGRGADKMTQMSKGLLKAFNTPRSRLSRLFGMGASGAAAFLRETFKSVEAMGHYAEVFGGSIMSDTKNAQALIEAQRSMGISAKETAYYAMDAYLTGKNPINYLMDLRDTIAKTAKDNKLDFKAISKAFHELRTNIVDFGNLTSNEVLKLTTKLRKMGISTEDAVAVFKKFTSLEEAAKTSAMLFQSFEMNVDAFDLLTARDPGEMLQQFRDAMFQTGRSFKDLDRHEKALMSSITGVSEKGLTSLMSYMNVGLTYDEAKRRMEEQDPTEQQIKMVKGLTSTIKLVQKTMMFDSPFQAFFRGLTNNAANQKDLRNAVLGLSKLYEDIYHLGFSLDLGQVSTMLGPITLILQKLNDLLTGDSFKTTLKLATQTAGDFLGDLGRDLQNNTAKAYYDFGKKVQDITRKANKDQLKTLEKVENEAKNAFIDSLDLSNPNRKTNKVLLEKMQKKGLIKQYQNGVFRLVKGISLEDINDKMQTISGQFADGSPIQSEIKKYLDATENEYAKQIGVLDDNVLKDLYEKANVSSAKRNTIEGRINHLYENLMEMVTQGSPLFIKIKDMGGRIMGSVIRGLAYGFSAALQIFAGNMQIGVDMLGLETTKTMSKEFGLKPGEKLGLMQLLGITDNEFKDMSQNFGEASAALALKLPSFISLAGTFIADLFGIFGDFAGGLLGFFGEMSVKAYEKSSYIFQSIMDTSGFNFTAAEKYANVGLGESLSKSNKIGSLLKDSDIITDDTKDNSYFDFEFKRGAITKTYGLLEGYKRKLNKKSYAYKFLNSPKVMQQLDYVLDDKNFVFTGDAWYQFGGAFTLLGNLVNDPDIEERVQATLHILSYATSLDSKEPSELYDLLNKKDLDKNLRNKINKQISNNKAANDRFFKTALGRIPDRSTSDYAGSMDLRNPLDIINSYKKIINNNLGNKVDNLDATVRSGKKQTKDYHLSGKGAVIYAGGTMYHLHDHDAIYAAKKGGYLNKVYTEIFDVYNLFTVELFNTVKTKHEEDMIAMSNVHGNIIKNIALEKSKVKRTEFVSEASDEDLLEIINLCIDVINLNKDRKLVTKNIKTQIQAV